MARRTKEEAQATRSDLLDAAERVFETRGVSRTTLAEVAQAAGLTRGAVYWHFKDKADLFDAMMTRATAPLNAVFLADDTTPPAVITPANDPIDTIWHALCTSVDTIVRDDRTQRVLRIALFMFEHSEDMADVKRSLQAQRADAIAQTARRLRIAARQRGVVLSAPGADPAHSCAEALHALVFGFVHGWLYTGADTGASAALGAHIEHAASAYLRGIGLPRNPVPPTPAADQG